MSMWLFFTLVNATIPCMTLLIGLLFYFKPPKKINYIYGYRTAMSMKNQETWDYAHRFCGRLWIFIGIFMLVATAALLYLFLSGASAKPDDRMALIVLMQVGLMVGSIIPVESQLRRVFDRSGNRKIS